MARPLRVEFEGALYHVMSRGADGRRIFHTIGDRNRFLSLVGDACVKYNALVYAYVLMDNHYHLLLETRNPNLSRLMHHINASYALYINWKYKKSGHVLQSRYKAVVVEKESYLLELSRYIHLNPVRAEICARPEEYRWSSCAYYAYDNEPPDWLCTGWVTDRFGKSEKTALGEYRKFVADGIHGEMPDPLEKTFAGVVLGTEDFARKIGEMTQKSEHREIPSTRQLPRLWDPRSIVSFVSKHFGIHPKELKKPQSRLPARKIAICLARRYTPAPIKEIAAYFGINYTTVPMIVKRVSQDRNLTIQLKKVEQLLTKVKT